MTPDLDAILARAEAALNFSRRDLIATVGRMMEASVRDVAPLVAEVRRLEAKVHVEEAKVRGDLAAIDDLHERAERAERERDKARAEVKRLTDKLEDADDYASQLRDRVGKEKALCDTFIAERDETRAALEKQKTESTEVVRLLMQASDSHAAESARLYKLCMVVADAMDSRGLCSTANLLRESAADGNAHAELDEITKLRDELFRLCNAVVAREAEVENLKRALAAARALCGEAADEGYGEEHFDRDLIARLRAEAVKGEEVRGG